MAIRIPQTLADELVREGILTEELLNQMIELAQSQNKDFGQTLIDNAVISENDLLEFKSRIYQLPIVKLDEMDVDKSVLKELSEDVVQFYKVVPFAKDNDVLKIGIIDPEDTNALEALKFISGKEGLKLEKYLIGHTDFNKITRNYRTLTGEVGEALESLAQELESKEVQEAAPKTKLEELSAEAPVTRIVAVIVRHAVESRASDIHIEPFEDRVRVRFRVDGILITSLTLPRNLHSAITTRIKILSDLKIDETRLAQDGRFATKLNERKIDFRVSTFPTKNGEKTVMRILDPMAGNITLEQLGLVGRSAEVLQRGMEKPFGSILITGPTGSGKSTTLAAMIRVINSEDINIVTLEDPIEYFVDGVNQSQVHEEIGYTFATGLRHILRQDPDVIMVGEIRDRETASLATQAALTGHIVFSTLHTNDSLGVIPRLVDMGVEKYLIPPTVNVAAAQRLLRRLCPDCKVQTESNVGEAKIISDALKSMPKEYQDQYLADSYMIFKPKTENDGNVCRTCGGKAFKGRIAIFEMMEMTPELEKIILTNLSEADMRAEAERQGMITMFEDGILKVLSGVVSLEELLEVAQSGDSA